MSYILDALRRADAERSRQADQSASDLSAQVTSAQRWPAATAAAPQRRLARPLAGVLLVGLALLAVVWWMGDAAAPPAQDSLSPAMAAEPASATAPVVTPPPEPAPAAAAPPAPILLPEPVPAPVSAVAPRQETEAAVQAPVRPAVPGQDPPVKITGSTYSDNPAHRMLIANGKVVQEGQEIEPGMTLEIITPHSAVINHQGTRFNVNY